MCRGVVLGLVSPGLDPAYSPAVVAQEALSTRCSQAFLPLPDPVCTPDEQNPGCKRNGADQDTVHDDVGEDGLQAQGDAPAGELLADRVVVTTDATMPTELTVRWISTGAPVLSWVQDGRAGGRPAGRAP